MNPAPADWQLPPGVDRGLWDYLHDRALAQGYDAALADSPLFHFDQQFAEEHFDRPGRLIDLGCGTGRLLIPLARRGYWVLGVDLSEAMLEIVEGKARAAAVAVHRIKANLVELDAVCDRSFDYASCLFSTLGMIAGTEARQRVVAHVHRLLRPGGRFVLHVHNRWFNFWDPQGRRWLAGDLARSLTARAQGGDRLMPMHLGIAGLTLHLFTRREIIHLLRDAGFLIREVRPLSLSADGRLNHAWCVGGLRAYGYLVAAERPAQDVSHNAGGGRP
jgi:SAM-dependent methyltransferase